MSYNIKRITTLGMLVAMEVVLSRFLSIRIPPTAEYLIKISFAFLPVAVAAMLFGPLWGGICAALGDVLGALFFQAGSVFFPGFTVTAFLTGAVYGLFLYNRPVRIANALAASALVNIVCSFGLNSLWLYIMYAEGSVAMLPGRALNAAAMIVVSTLCVVFFYKVLAPQRAELTAGSKRALRLSAKSLINSAPALLEETGAGITENLLALPEYKHAATVFCYIGVEGELATSAIIAHALQQGKRVCAPRCESGGAMTAKLYSSEEELVKGRLGLLEPPESAPTVPSSEIDFAVVPALLCGRDFARIGKGGGYYDRYLASAAFTKAAIVPGKLLRRSLPRDKFDVLMDIIVTESETLRRDKTK